MFSFKIEQDYNVGFFKITAFLILILLSLKFHLFYKASYFNYYIVLFCIPNITILLNIREEKLLNYLSIFSTSIFLCILLVSLGHIHKRNITHLTLLFTLYFLLTNYKYVYRKHIREVNTAITNYLHCLFAILIIISILDYFYFIKLIPIFDNKEVILFCVSIIIFFYFIFSLLTILLTNMSVTDSKTRPKQIENVQPSIDKQYVPKKMKDKDFLCINNAKLTPEAKSVLKYLDTSDIYLDTNFTIDDLTRELGIPKHTLSKIINHDMDLNFYTLIAKYRIEYAKKLIVKEQNLLLDAIMIECGFNSRITFNKYFKEFTGLTPSEYRKNTI